MNEHELRLIVREAVARHLGGPVIPSSPHLPIPSSPHLPIPSSPHPPISPSPHPHPHPSAALYAGLVNVTDACVIEPAVACDHCGFCKSHGH